MKTPKFVMSPQDMTEIYADEMQQVLSILGHPEGFATDESDVGDFIEIFERTIPVKTRQKLEKASGLTDITMNTKLWRIAQAINKNAE